MTTTNKTPDPNNKEIANTDSGKKSEDTLDENTGDDTLLAKSMQPNEQNNPDEPRVDTVSPGFDKGHPGAPADDDKPDANKGQDEADRPSSNKGQGPAGENL